METGLISELNCLRLSHIEEHEQEKDTSSEALFKIASFRLSSNVKQDTSSNRNLFPLVAVSSFAPAENQAQSTSDSLTSAGHLSFDFNRRVKDAKNLGLAKKYIRQLKKLKICKTSQSCSICQHAFVKDELIVQLPCKHIFHKAGCLSQWLKISVFCPICKFNLDEHFRNQPTTEEAEVQLG